MLQALGLASGILIVISYIPYIRDILTNKTKPERASWFIWLILGSIVFFSQLAQGGSASLFLPATETVFTVIIFLLSLKFGTGGLSKRDIIGLVAAGIGLVMWFYTKQPSVALIIAIFIDLTGAILTIIKAYKEPSSETLITWVLTSLAGILSMFSVGRINWVLLIYPTYIFVGNGVTALAIILGKNNQQK